MSERDPQQPEPASHDRQPAARSKISSWFGNWARDTFSREQLISSFKSFLWVAPLTILIWVYAEREQTHTQPQQPIPIALRASDPKMIVTLLDPVDKNLLADLKGSRVQVDQVRSLLVPKDGQTPVTIEIGPEYAPGGPYTLQSSAAGNTEIFRSNGVVASNFSPPTLRFTVDMIVSREIEVSHPSASEVKNLVALPVIEPRKVTVTAPEKLLQDAEAANKLRVVADFSRYKELETPGKHELVVPLTLPFNDRNDRNVSVNPTSVKVTIDVRQLDVEYERESIPVHVTYPPGLDKNYRAEYDGTLPFVKFYGPQAIIDKMKQPNAPPDMQPKARFEVSRSDITNPVGGEKSKRLQFDLPPGVRVSPADENRTITFRLVEQTPTE